MKPAQNKLGLMEQNFNHFELEVDLKEIKKAMEAVKSLK